VKVYFRGGKIEDNQRVREMAEVSMVDAQREMFIRPYKFKLNAVRAMDGGLIYNCINDDVEMDYCDECSGHGKTTCPQCDGDGEIDCEECEGIGMTESDAGKKAKKKMEEEAKAHAEFLKNQISLEF